MKHIYNWLIAAGLLTITKSIYAQSHRQQVRAHIDSALTARYYRTPYDTNYVIRPEGALTLKLRLNETGESYHVRGEKDGIHYRAISSAVRPAHGSQASAIRAIASRPPTNSRSARPMPPRSISTSDSSASAVAMATTSLPATSPVLLST